MGYCVNEKVRINDGLLKGETATIVEVLGDDRYRIDRDRGCHIWGEHMFDKPDSKQYKCKDEVLYRFNYHKEGKTEPWIYGVFSHYKKKDDRFGTYDVVINGNCYPFADTDIIPFKGNEYLVGTTNEPDPGIEMSIDSPVMALTDNGNWVLAEYKGFICDDEKIIVKFTNGQIVYVKVIIPLNAFYFGDNHSEYISVKNNKLMKVYGEGEELPF